jgi:hypothetical protein
MRLHNLRWLQHDKIGKHHFRGRRPVTVCVGTLFQWNYAGPGEPENRMTAGIVASDRMLTAGDVQYEPPKLKMAQMTPRVMALLAGDYPLHSQAIIDARKLVQGSPDKSPENVAQMYGKAIQNIKQRQAEDYYLAPLGMNSDTFIAQQKEMAGSFIDHITHQLQSYQGEDVEALVVGSDGERVHLYTVDTKGIAHCMNDVGFAAIGIGAWHAKSRLMQVGYANTAYFAPALAATYAAKRSADIAPGVGQHTDVWLMLKDSMFPLWPSVDSKLNGLYAQYEKDRNDLMERSVSQLQEIIDEAGREATAAGNAGTGATPNGGASAPAPEASRKDEGGAAKTVNYE